MKKQHLRVKNSLFPSEKHVFLLESAVFSISMQAALEKQFSEANIPT
jgi:hypothetical protein